MKRILRLLFFLFLLQWTHCTNKSENPIYTGIIEGKIIQIPALTGGKISHLFAEEGQTISIGDTLALIDTTELALEHRQLKTMLEEIAIQKRICQTKENQAESDLDYAEQEYERMKALVDGNVTPKQNLDQLNNQLQKAYSAFEIARQQTQSISAKQKQLLVQLELLRKKITDAIVVAPINGFISSRYYESGEAVPPLQPLFELIRNDQMEVKIYISENQLVRVFPGQEVHIRIDGLENELSGYISWISPKSEFTPKMILTPDTRTSLVYAVIISVDNIGNTLKHGMPVEIVLNSE